MSFFENDFKILKLKLIPILGNYEKFLKIYQLNFCNQNFLWHFPFSARNGKVLGIFERFVIFQLKIILTIKTVLEIIWFVLFTEKSFTARKKVLKWRLHRQNWHFQPSNILIKMMKSLNIANLNFKIYHLFCNFTLVKTSSHYHVYK